jgi:hypothetical protein
VAGEMSTAHLLDRVFTQNDPSRSVVQHCRADGPKAVRMNALRVLGKSFR